MSLLDSLLGGYVYAQQDGQPSAAPSRRTLIFSGATVTDDGPTANSTTVTISGGGGSFPGGDLCSGTGTTVSVGSRLTLAGGTLSADAQLTGTSSQLAAGDGSAVTVGSGLTLAAGTLTASGGGGITQLTTDLLAGPGSGTQTASAVKATGEITGPNGPTWWYPNKAGSYGMYNSPDGSPVCIWRVPGAYPSTAGAYVVLNADGSNVYLGGTAGGAYPIETHVKAQHGVFIHGEADRVVRRTIDNISNGAQSLWQVQQPSMFSNIEPYGGGAGAFTCDTGLYTTSLIECRFGVGGGGGTINLPALANPGRVLHIGDGTGTISVGDPLVIQPLGGKSVGGGAPGVAVTITTSGWAQKLVLDSTGNNWMIF